MRGGKREGAGRKKVIEGWREVISLTLTDFQWDEIAQSGLSPAAYIRQLMDGVSLNKAMEPKQDRQRPTGSKQPKPLYDEQDLNALWECAAAVQFKAVPAELLEEARLRWIATFRQLRPRRAMSAPSQINGTDRWINLSQTLSRSSSNQR